ncbi:hypothetical protein ACFV10_22210 [Streptomyces cyaneofuscatus]|uniref:hypothetical protein n=1 Tax=Streptomyces cyaneofuscatus TaxID=66883 RepID=UPI00367A49A4
MARTRPGKRGAPDCAYPGSYRAVRRRQPKSRTIDRWIRPDRGVRRTRRRLRDARDEPALARPDRAIGAVADAL